MCRLYIFCLLQIIVELASASKEFPIALARTKLAEMTGKAKFVPIAQTNSQPPVQQPERPPVAPVVNKPPIEESSQSAPRGLGMFEQFLTVFCEMCNFYMNKTITENNKEKISD